MTSYTRVYIFIRKLSPFVYELVSTFPSSGLFINTLAGLSLMGVLVMSTLANDNGNDHDDKGYYGEDSNDNGKKKVALLP